MHLNSGFVMFGHISSSYFRLGLVRSGNVRLVHSVMLGQVRLGYVSLFQFKSD